MLTSSHPVDYSRFLHREAVSLARAGYPVTLVGLGPGPASRVSDAVRLVPVPSRAGLAKGATLARIREAAVAEEAAAYHCFDPWTLGIGLSIKRRRPQTRLVYDSTELYPAVYVQRRDLPLPVRWLLAARVRSLERTAARRADAIIETNEIRAARFRALGREPVLVPNYPPLESVPEPSVRREQIIAYTGLVSRERGFDRLLEAFATLSREVSGARLRVIGGFDPRSDIEARTMACVAREGIRDRVEFTGWLPYERMFAELRACSAGVILLQPGRENDYTGQPNKLFEFMAMGMAVIASRFPAIEPVVGETGCGWLVDPTDTADIARALTEALTSPEEAFSRGLAGREAVLERYNWRTAEASLVALYRRLLP